MPDPLVELHYTLTEDDWIDGFVAHRRRIRRPWLVPLLIAAALVGLLLGGVLSGSSGPSSLTDAAVLATLTVVAVGLGLLLFRRLVVARWLYRWQVRTVMRGNPWLSEPIRAVVDDTGLLLASASRAETAAWQQYLRYVETDRSFVLRASERTGAAVLVLPKRGLVDADPTTLRTLLETHCHESAKASSPPQPRSQGRPHV